MNKLFRLIIVFSISFSVQAQEFKGLKSIGLQLGYGQTNTEGGVGIFGGRVPEITTSYNISLEFTYFLSNRWRIGGSLNFATSKRRRYPDDAAREAIHNSSSYGMEFLTTYHHWFTKKFSFIIESSLGYSYTNLEGGDVSFSSRGNRQSLFVDSSVGVLFLINNKFGIDLSTPLLRLTYDSSDFESERLGFSSSSYNNSELNFFFLGGSIQSALNNMSIGVKYFF